jgi:PAS domain S-box-containing protein
MFVSAGLATLYFIVLPVIWLGTLGPEPLGKELALELGPTFAPLFGGAAKAAAIWFMILNMFHGTMAPLAGAARTLAQLAEDGLLPEFMGKRSRTDAPWVTTVITAFMAITFLLCGDPVWLIAAANLTYLIGISLPNVAVWLLRNDQPNMMRPYRAPRGTIALGLIAAAAWFLTAILGFQQFGLPTVLIGIAFAYSGSALYAWRKFMDRRKHGLNGIAHSLHIKLTGAMLLVLVLDGFGYLIAVGHVNATSENAPLIAALEDIFVVVALLTISVGLILPGMIAHSAVEVSVAADKLVTGTLADFTRAMRALAAGDLGAANARISLTPVLVNSRDEVGEMAANFNRLQEEIGRAALGLQGARDGILEARNELTEMNGRLRVELAERRHAEEALRQLRDHHAMILNSINEGVHGIDSEGKIIFENPAALKMLGYEITELIGKYALETIQHTRSNGALSTASDSPIFATLHDGRIRHTDGEVFWRKDGTSFPVDFTTTPVRDEKGKIIGATVVFTDITERKQAELEIERVNRQLLETSRKAGMAEVATSVLHNVGNALNSVNVSCTVISDTVRKSRLNNIKKTASLLNDHAGDLASFFNNTAAGNQLPGFLTLLGERLEEEQSMILAELQSLSNNIEHIKAIIAVQQGYASATGTMETLPIQDLVEIALRMNSERLTRHQVEIVRDYCDVPPLDLKKHSVLQVLVNLVRNAKHAVMENGQSNKQIIVRIFRPDGHTVAISILDNGIGIPPENLARIFTRGFTTKAEGHGFGLHASLQAAQDMGGRLHVHSDGLGKGCTFTLELPLGKTRHV